MPWLLVGFCHTLLPLQLICFQMSNITIHQSREQKLVGTIWLKKTKRLVPCLAPVFTPQMHDPYECNTIYWENKEVFQGLMCSSKIFLI